MRNSHPGLIVSIILFVASTLVSGIGQAADEGSWSNAGEKTKEAASAVGDATVNTAERAWDATKKGSEKARDATKEGAAKTYDATEQAVQ